MRSNLKVQNLVYKMLTENTGVHMCDSGGDSGRAWQRNQKLAIKDFKNRPSCVLEVSKWNESFEFNVTIDIFHYLIKNLDLDSVCNKFNRKNVSNWNSDEFYGVSDIGEKFLLEHFEVEGRPWNSYNWCGNFSQDVQGSTLKCKSTGDEYILLQIHNGADARGGYTDAKLFKSDCEYFLQESCYFDCGLDWSGEWINHEGTSPKTEEFDKIANDLGVSDGNDVTIKGWLGE